MTRPKYHYPPAAPAKADEPAVEDYRFEPIQGYPMLHWQGKRPFTSTHYYPAQRREVYGPEVDGWRNRLFWGDNLQVMAHLLKEFRGKVQLVYIDPPFDSKAEYKKKINLRGRPVTGDHNAFEEKQYTDIWTNDEYLQFMYERIILIRELLADTGSVYLHCDWHRSHYLRCVMDEVFGASNFLNEIVWKRASTVKGNFGQGTKGYGANTDTIFLYSKSEQILFHPQYQPYSQKYTDNFYRYTEPETGRRYRLISMIGPGGGTKGNPRYEVMGVTKYWRYSKETMQQLIDAGLVIQTNPGTVPQRKQYLDEGMGVSIQSLWEDIEALGASSNERFDYPTQKPETLLERIILASSNPGDLVFDCFCGSGTTQAVAMRLGRRFLGADINLGAIQITTQRLLTLADKMQEAGSKRQEAGGKRQEAGEQIALGLTPSPADQRPPTDDDLPDSDSPTSYSLLPTPLFTGFEVYTVNHYDIFRNPVEAKELLLQALEVQPLAPGHLFDGEKDGRLVKVMPVNRIATRADLNELIHGFDYTAFERRQADHPLGPVEQITLVCMGHEPDLAAILQTETQPYKLDVQVVDILRDRDDLVFKRDAEADIAVEGGALVIRAFYPLNLLHKLSLQKETVADWRELVESVLVDWNYDGAALQPATLDLPGKNDLVAGRYLIPPDAGTIRVKITDLLSESLEVEVAYA